MEGFCDRVHDHRRCYQHLVPGRGKQVFWTLLKKNKVLETAGYLSCPSASAARRCDRELCSEHKQQSHGGLPHHPTPLDAHVLAYEPSKAIQKPRDDVIMRPQNTGSMAFPLCVAGSYRTLELEEHPCVELRVIVPQRLDALAVAEAPRGAAVCMDTTFGGSHSRQ